MIARVTEQRAKSEAPGAEGNGPIAETPCSWLFVLGT